MKNKPPIEFKEKVTVINGTIQVSESSATQVLNTGTLLLESSTHTGKYFEPRPINYYNIDFDKIKTINDVVSILKEMNLQVSEESEGFKNIKHLLKEK